MAKNTWLLQGAPRSRKRVFRGGSANHRQEIPYHGGEDSYILIPWIFVSLYSFTRCLFSVLRRCNLWHTSAQPDKCSVCVLKIQILMTQVYICHTDLSYLHIHSRNRGAICTPVKDVLHPHACSLHSLPPTRSVEPSGISPTASVGSLKKRAFLAQVVEKQQPTVCWEKSQCTINISKSWATPVHDSNEINTPLSFVRNAVWIKHIVWPLSESPIWKDAICYHATWI